MGWLRKKAKQIGKAIKKVGKKFKTIFGKVAKAFGKLGPLGTIAMSFILPGLGSTLTGWLSNFSKGVMNMLPQGAQTFLGNVGEFIRTQAGNFKEGVKSVFGSITDGIEAGINKIGSVFGKGDIGTNARNFFDELSGGKIGKVETTEIASEDVSTLLSQEKSVIDSSLAEKFTPDTTDTLFTKPKKGEQSLFDLAGMEELTPVEKIKLSKEAKAYKRMASLGQFGQGIQNQEQNIKLQKEYEEEVTRDYFKNFAQQNLNIVGSETLSGQPVGFIDTNSFRVNANPFNNFMEQIFNFTVPENQDALQLAMGTNTYGYNIYDVLKMREY